MTEVHPDIKVNLQFEDWSTFWTKLKTQVASGTTADIIGMQSGEMPVYAAQGIFEPLDSFIENSEELQFDDFNQAIVEGMTYDGTIYALPYDYGALTLFYNKNLFDKYDVPYPDKDMTWDGFLERAKQLTHPDENEFGYAIQGNLWNMTPWIWQNGGEWLTEDEKYVVNDPKIVEALEFVSELVNVHRVSPTGAELSSNPYDERWMAGKIGMIIEGPWSIISYKQFADFDFGAQVLPESPKGSNVSFIAGSGFGISAQSKHKEEAFKAISVLTEKDSLESLAQDGRAYPARNSAVEVFNEYNNDIENMELFMTKPNIQVHIGHRRITLRWKRSLIKD